MELGKKKHKEQMQ